MLNSLNSIRIMIKVSEIVVYSPVPNASFPFFNIFLTKKNHVFDEI